MSDNDDILLKYLEGQLETSEAQKLEERLKNEAQNGELKRALESRRAFLSALAAPDPSADAVDLLPKLQARLNAPKKRFNVVAMAAGIAATLGVAILSYPGLKSDPEFRPKAMSSTSQTKWTGIHAYTIDPSDPSGEARESLEIRQNASLAFSYTNQSAHQYSYLMIFSIDANGEIHWYHPAYTSIDQDPSSISIHRTKGQVFLPDKISQALAPGTMTIFGLFSDRAMHAKKVEQQYPEGALEKLKGVYIQKIQIEVLKQ